MSEYNLYANKTPEIWTKILLSLLPKGEAWKGAMIDNSVHNMLYKSAGTIAAKLDTIIANKVNKFVITEDNDYLDTWWDNLNLQRFIVKPSRDVMAKLITFFLRARLGVFTEKQIEDLVQEIFGIEIDIKVSTKDDFNSNVFPLVFPFVFFKSNTTNDSLYTVIISSPETEGREDYKTAIKAIIDYLININYMIYYIINSNS